MNRLRVLTGFRNSGSPKKDHGKQRSPAPFSSPPPATTESPGADLTPPSKGDKQQLIHPLSSSTTSQSAAAFICIDDSDEDEELVRMTNILMIRSIFFSFISLMRVLSVIWLCSKRCPVRTCDVTWHSLLFIYLFFRSHGCFY